MSLLTCNPFEEIKVSHEHHGIVRITTEGERLVQAAALIGVCAALQIVTGLHYITGHEAVFFLYFIPVLIAAWFTGGWTAAAVGVLSAFAWTITDHVSDLRRSLSVFVVWDAGIRVIPFFVVAYAVAKLRRRIDVARGVLPSHPHRGRIVHDRQDCPHVEPCVLQHPADAVFCDKKDTANSGEYEADWQGDRLTPRTNRPANWGSTT